MDLKYVYQCLAYILSTWPFWPQKYCWNPEKIVKIYRLKTRIKQSKKQDSSPLKTVTTPSSFCKADNRMPLFS